MLVYTAGTATYGWMLPHVKQEEMIRRGTRSLFQAPQPTKPFQIALPGVKHEIGLGELLARASKMVGVRHCAGCSGRAVTLDQIAMVTGRRRK